jgi:hypothetical protein
MNGKTLLRRRWIGRGSLLLGIVVVAACAFSSLLRIGRHEIRAVRTVRFNSFELDRIHDRLLIPELLTYYRNQSPERREEARLLDARGRALAACRRYGEAREALEKAWKRHGPVSGLGGRAAWAASQAGFQSGRAADALSAAREADDRGFPIPRGWLAYLEALDRVAPLFNRIEGERGSGRFQHVRPRVPRIDVRMNGRDALGILDTGAAITLVSSTEARRLGIEPFPECEAEGSGLHGSRYPVRFGLVREVEVAGILVRDLPIGIVDDADLEFETPTGRVRYELLLGCHLWKEFRLVLDYPSRRYALERVKEPPSDADVARANLFVIDGKPVARGSMQGIAWFRFLIDTGSEFSLVHKAGSRRYGVLGAELPIEPITVHGIGRSRSQWGKLSGITFGLDRFQVSYDDLLVTDDDETADDAIIGDSFLESFVVTLDFGRLSLTLRLPDRDFEPFTPPTGMGAGEGKQ